MRTLLPILIALPVAAQAAPQKPAAFAPCSACHKVEKAQPNGLGPNLWGVGGRKAAKVPGFVYSPALQKSGITWTRKELIAYVTRPQTRVPGTKMYYPGQPDPAKAAAVADYLLGLK